MAIEEALVFSKRLPVIVLAIALGVMLVVPAAAGERFDVGRSQLGTVHDVRPSGPGDRPPLERNLELVGLYDDPGFFEISDVWAHGDYAYLRQHLAAPVQRSEPRGHG